MDNLTHSLTGYFLSRAGLNRLTPHATPILLLAANAPDIDVVSGFGGQAALLHWHRNFTHSLFFAPVLALAAVALVRLIYRTQPAAWLGGFIAALAGVGSHLLLDLTNNYGVRLLEPFSSRWLAWDTTYVIDPYIWAILLVMAGAPLLGRLLQSEMGQTKRTYPPRGAAWFALICVLFYEGGRAAAHARAIQTLDARLYAGEAPRRVAAFPTPLSPFAWNALVETSGRFALYELNLNEPFDPDAGRTVYKNDPGAAVSLLREKRDFRALIEFAQYPVWRVITEGNSVSYRLTDLRFGDPVAQTFTCAGRIVQLRTLTDERCNFSFAPNFGK